MAGYPLLPCMQPIYSSMRLPGLLARVALQWATKESTAHSWHDQENRDMLSETETR